MMAGLLTRWFRSPPPLRLPSAEAYAVWAACYPPHPHNPLMRLEQAIMAPMLAACQPAVALDVGTGTGRYLGVLRDSGARVVVGVDLSPAMLAHRAGGSPVVCGDACRLPFASGRFDLVCASLMAGDLPDVSPWLREAARVLRPGGHLFYSDFHPEWSRRGWRRTFTAGGRELELPYAPHAIEEHLRHIEEAGLAVHTIREPKLPERNIPVLALFHAEKPVVARDTARW